MNANDILERPTVLVLNRNWQAVNVRTPAQAFCQMATDAATALEIDVEEDGEVANMIPRRWDDWLSLPIRDDDIFVGTPRGQVRVPQVIVLARFDRVPTTRPKLNSRGIRARDQGRCQYTGRQLKPGEGNIDHVIPLSRGGDTSWTNCVLACREINAKKANRLPHEAGLRLLRKPQEPRAVPVTLTIRNHFGIAAWNPFLPKTQSSTA